MAPVDPLHSTVPVEPPPPAYSYSNKQGSSSSTTTTTGSGGVKNHVAVDLFLRVIMFATALVSIIVIVTSKQTKLIPVAPGLSIPMAAEFNQSPAFIYFVAALSVACLYSIITGALSILALVKPKGSSSTDLLFYFVILDALLLGIMGSATGAAGAVGYVGYKGNSHTRWNKVCDVYGSFCGHIAGAITVSLLPSIALLLLIWLSVFVLSKNITRS